MSKRIDRKLRELAGFFHERALARAPGDLSVDFERWREGAMDAFELNDKIHEFRNKTGKRIYSFYVGPEPWLIVVAALLGTRRASRVCARLTALRWTARARSRCD